MRLRTLSLLSFLALVGSMASSPALADVAPEDPLYFTDPSFGAGTFTTFPPEGSEPIPMEPSRSSPPRIMWLFEFAASPTNWSLTAGDEIVTTLHFRGLAEVLPADDPFVMTPPGKMRIEVGLFVGGGVESDQASNAPLAPSDAAVASGEAFIDHPAAGGEPDPTVVVTSVVREDLEVPWNLTVELAVILSGVTRSDARPDLYLYGREAASMTRIPGFPMEALRAKEEATRAERACNERILRQEPCETETPPEKETAEGSLPGLPAFLLLVGIVVVSARRRAQG